MKVGQDEVEGIWTIVYAFFDKNERLDRALMRRQTKAVVAGRPHGIACLGLATEVVKLTTAERRQLMEWVAEDTEGALPLAVTIAEATVDGQIAFARAAAEVGASFVILQPPPVAGLAEIEYIRFFGRVAEASPIPVALQNAAAYIGIGLSPDGLATLARNHANLRLLKGEGPAVEIAATVERTAGVFRVLNGRGGLELPDNLRAGCVGMIPAPDCFERQVTLYEAFKAGRIDEAEAIYREIAPAIVFVMQSIQHLLCYGKRLTAARLGIPFEDVHDRAPAMPPTPFGLAATQRFADALGPLAGS
jgi:dihydrodipicolinate synthase/N-acetylneuraminate lyase